MNNSLVEKALESWLAPFVGEVEVITGMDTEEMEIDAQAVVVGVPNIARPVPALGVAEVVVVVATPFHIEGALEAHRALVTAIESALSDVVKRVQGVADDEPGEPTPGVVAITAALTTDAALAFAGVSPRSTENDSEGNRWLTSLPFALGLCVP